MQAQAQQRPRRAGAAADGVRRGGSQHSSGHGHILDRSTSSRGQCADHSRAQCIPRVFPQVGQGWPKIWHQHHHVVQIVRADGDVFKTRHLTNRALALVQRFEIKDRNPTAWSIQDHRRQKSAALFCPGLCYGVAWMHAPIVAH